jgi:hypothetical protein
MILIIRKLYQESLTHSFSAESILDKEAVSYRVLTDDVPDEKTSQENQRIFVKIIS